MTTKFCAPIMLLIALPAQSEELVKPVAFSSDMQSESLRVDNGTLQISAVRGQPKQVLIELPQPGITGPIYALKGMIRYEGVEGDGYLQLDNHFDAQGTYFTKSLAESGPLKKISGSSAWRPFALPFHTMSGDGATAKALTPDKLALSLNLLGNGTVFIREVGLYQYADGEDPLASTTQWVTSRTATLMGAVVGSVVGLWGGLIGFLTSRGRARGFVLGSTNLLIAFGIVSLGAGVIALTAGQPYVVYYPLLLIGIILIFVLGGLRKSLPKRYEALELQKIRVMDA